MAISKKSQKVFRLVPTGAVRKNGFCAWRFFFSGVENTTGMERRFFVEFIMLNPAVAPDEPVLGFKNRTSIKAEDLQNVLAGTISAQKLQSEEIAVPSYICVKAGQLGAGAKEVCAYTSLSQTVIHSRPFEFSACGCSFSEEVLSGRIAVSPSDLQTHPEYMCDSGIINWDLRFDIRRDFADGFTGKTLFWSPVGAQTAFSGTFTIDGKVYSVLPKKSFGYIDRFYGKAHDFPYVHLSSSNLTSIISGKTLQNSVFVIQGVYNDRISLIVNLEGSEVVFQAQKGRRSFESHWDFSQMPENGDQEKLHWTVSVHNSKYVVDIDVFCPAQLMFVRSAELPEGQRHTIKKLVGGTGTGEIRLYKKIHRNLELIEHAQISTALCEFGQKEEAEL